MTNAQSYLETATQALEEGKLSGSAKSFIESIRDYSKKQLNNLTSKQFNFLRDVANQNS
jgi:hypothetical protein